MSTLITNAIDTVNATSDLEFKTQGVTRMKITAAGALTAGDATIFGVVVQVVQTVFRDDWTNASAGGNWARVPGCDASITPASTDNKVLVRMNVPVSISSSTTVMGTLYRKIDSGSWAVVSGAIHNEYGNSRQEVTTRTVPTNPAHMDILTLEYLDSPNSTGVVTYGIYVKGHTTGYHISVNRDWNGSNTVNGDNSGTISTTTLQEIMG